MTSMGCQSKPLRTMTGWPRRRKWKASRCAMQPERPHLPRLLVTARRHFRRLISSVLRCSIARIHQTNARNSVHPPGFEATDAHTRLYMPGAHPANRLSSKDGQRHQHGLSQRPFHAARMTVSALLHPNTECASRGQQGDRRRRPQLPLFRVREHRRDRQRQEPRMHSARP